MGNCNNALRTQIVFFQILCLLAIGFNSFSADTDPSLLAHYRLDANAEDSSTNRLNGIAQGIASTINRFGSTNSAVQFTGTASFIDLGNPAQFNFFGSFSITAWVRVGNNSAATYMIGKYGDYGNGNREPHSYGLGLDPGYRLYGFVSTLNNDFAEVIGGPSLFDQRWHAVGMTYDSAYGIRIYENGSLVGETRVVGAGPFTNQVPLMLGRVSTGQFFKGEMDDVRIYNRALTSDEMRDLYLSDSDPAGVYIREQPQSQWIEAGTNATFKVEVSGQGKENALFQWFEDGVAITGATNSSYTTDVQSIFGRRFYSATIRVNGFTLTSRTAVLIVGLLDERDLIAHWNFDDEFTTNVIDSAGGFDGRVVNGVRVPGAVGSGALDLNGTNAYVYVGGQGTALELEGPYTLSWWQKWRGLNGKHQVVLGMDDGQDFSGGYQAFLFIGTPEFALVHSDGINQTWLTGESADNEWRHYAFTFDGSALRLYRDGALAATRARSTPIIQDGDDPLVIGAIFLQNGTPVNLFNGLLDDIRIYSRALGAEEIARLGPPPEILVTKEPRNVRIGEGEKFTLMAAASARGTTNALVYQWEMNGNRLAGATNETLLVTGIPGTTNVFRVLFTAGDLKMYSREALVETASSKEAGLILNLSFENLSGNEFIDSIGGRAFALGEVTQAPGRVGNYGVALTGEGALRIPAAASDLELVGTSYTIAFWLKPGVLSGARQIFTIGDPLIGETGYGARLEGSVFNAGLRTEHRNGQSQPLVAPARTGTNWVHVAVVYNGLRRTIFINGVGTNSVAESADIAGSGLDDLLLGAESNRFSNVGVLDDFRIYNFPLASDEIVALANVPKPALLLTINRNGSNLEIRWTRDDSAQYRVEYATSLNPGTAWLPISAPIQTTALYYSVAQPLVEATRFYRLRQL